MIADGTRLQEMIDQVLAVARIENRGLSYDLTERTPAELLSSLRRANADITDPTVELENFRILTDTQAVALVVNSLTDNALTHGASHVSIDYGLDTTLDILKEVGIRPETALYITVTDDGPGIDEHFVPRVFEKFEKSSFSPGTGLGLYMARTIVEALNGSLGVATSSDGTTFQIALPVVRTLEPASRT